MKKLFSILAAVLFAGSMMADVVTFTKDDFAGQGTANTGSEVTATKGGVTFTYSKGYCADESLRCYAHGALSITASATIEKINFTTTGGKTGGLDAEVTVNATSYEVADLASQARFTEIAVTLAGGETPPAPTMNYYVTGNMTNWAPNADYMLTPDNEGLYKGEFTFAANDEFKVTYSDGTTIDNANWFPSGMNNNFQITEAGDYAITFNPAGNVEDWYYGYFQVAKKEEPVLPDPTNCAEAAEAALSVENNNDLYKDGAVYSITGYVTSIQTAYNAQYSNISFWIADAADGGNVIEAYRAVCASAEDAPIVGDKVTVTGSLTKYNTTPEFAAGCTYVIVEHATPVVPEYLGHMTIAEFIALANTVDTCELTGIVANIKKNDDGSYNKYGNFDLVEDEASVYVYGLLTADGQAQKFQEMGVDEGDTLTIKAVYSLYNDKVQAKNAVFVAVKKAATTPVEGDTIALVFEDGWVDNTYFEDYGSTDLVLYNIPVDETTYDFVGDGQYLNLDFYPENANDITGTYTIADETLDDYYTYMMVITGTDTAEVAFTAGEVTFNVLAKSEEQMAAQIAIAAELTGDDGNIYTINGTFVLYYDFLDEEEGVENVAAEQKSIKRIVNGQLFIEKNGVRYNANGAVVR